MTGPKRYRKKPVEIEAAHFADLGRPGLNQQEAREIAWWIAGRPDDLGGGEENLPEYGSNYIVIETLEGAMTASLGDFIIQGVQGEFYPCKPDIFAQTYEEAN
jgi:hypothetical protein